MNKIFFLIFINSFFYSVFSQEINNSANDFLSNNHYYQLNIKRIMEELYKDKNGFTGPDSDCKTVDDSGGCSVYGELEYHSLLTILKELDHINALKGTFYDLGSGNGKLVVEAILNFSSKFKKCIGIELCRYRFEQSIIVRDELIKNKLVLPEQIQFRYEDIADTDFNDAKIIFMDSVLYPDPLMEKLVDKFSKLKQGTIIISMKELPKKFLSLGINLIKTYKLPTTWCSFPGESTFMYILYNFKSKYVHVNELVKVLQLD